MRQAICYMPAHSHQCTNHRRDTYSRICLGHRSVNVTQRAYSCLASCNKPGRCRADLLVSLLRISFLYLDSGSIWPTLPRSFATCLTGSRFGVLECRDRRTVTVWVTSPVLLVSRLPHRRRILASVYA